MENHFPVVVTCARLQDGKEIPCTLKAWCNDRTDQALLWELRRIVDACGKGNSKVPLHKLVKTSWRQAEGEWKNVCETLGLEENWVVPSKRALGSKDGAWSQSADADLARGEYSIKTLPMLCLLLHWATSSRAGAVKECCCFLFRRLLGTVLPTQVVRQLLNPLADNSYQQVCLQRDGLKPCAHVQQCLSHVESGLAGDELWHAFLRVLTSCYTFLEECPALKRALAAMLQATAAKLDEALPAAGSLDVFEALTNDPSKHKRRRVDEDVQKETQKRAAEDNLTTGVFAKTHKVAHNSVAWKWDHQDNWTLTWMWKNQNREKLEKNMPKKYSRELPYCYSAPSSTLIHNLLIINKDSDYRYSAMWNRLSSLIHTGTMRSTWPTWLYT